MKPLEIPKVFKTTIPGNMTMEDWQAGGFSTFLHGNKDCSEEVSKSIQVFKLYLLDNIEKIIDENIDSPLLTITKLIVNYKP